MRMVLLGPPGCGKGTQAVLIKGEFGVPQISTGDILRTAVREGTDLGKKAEGCMNSGQLVPNQLIIDLMSERIKADDCKKGYILDGFPRTIEQAEALDRFLEKRKEKLDLVVSIDVADEEVVKRLGGRRQCKGCGEGYHVEFKKPLKENVCDKCGGELYLRDDDKEVTILSRLSVYRSETAPLITYYKDKGLLRQIPGVGSIEDIYKKISSLINNISP